jgi:hypothetical protein
MAVRDTLHEKDGAWKLDSKIAAGIDDKDNTHPLNCTEDGTLEVEVSGTSTPIDVIVDNVVPVSQSGTWTVNLATEPIIDIGKVDQGTPGTAPWPVTENASTGATVTAVAVSTTSALLLNTNLSRKGLMLQCKNSNMYVILGTVASTSLYSFYIFKNNVYEVENYYGPIAAILDAGSDTVMVTEKI